MCKSFKSIQVIKPLYSQGLKAETFYSSHFIDHEREETLCTSPIFHFWPEIMRQGLSKIHDSMINVELYGDTHPKPIATQ